MTQQSPGSRRWPMVVLIVLGVLGFVLFAVVFLVLTGIIAEPETVIENIIRALIK